MRRVVIVQARMTSTRLPGKVLADVAGRPMLERQLQRLARCRNADEIHADHHQRRRRPAAALGERLGVGVHRGSEHDVLARYAGAAAEFRADVVVRVTSDCPLIDPEQTDAVIDALGPEVDYASNVLERRLPRGLDTEALWRDTLERTARMATSVPAREHVTWHIHTEHPERFVLRSVRPALDAADLRWTVDTAADLALVRPPLRGAGPRREPPRRGRADRVAARTPRCGRHQRGRPAAAGLVSAAVAIPYGRQSITEEDVQAVVDVLRGDRLTQGPAVAAFEQEFAAPSTRRTRSRSPRAPRRCTPRLAAGLGPATAADQRDHVRRQRELRGLRRRDAALRRHRADTWNVSARTVPRR